MGGSIGGLFLLVKVYFTPFLSTLWVTFIMIQFGGKNSIDKQNPASYTPTEFNALSNQANFHYFPEQLY